MIDINIKTNILIVDDTTENLYLLKRILNKEGYKVQTAIDGPMALDGVQEELPDLILLDIMMPGMSGYEVCENLKKDERTRDIPVIFITAKADTKSIVNGFERGGVDYIIKPFNRMELLARVKTHLKLKYYRESLELSNKKLQKVNRKLIKSQKQLKLAARTDSLTKLSNRRDMIKKIKEERIRFERSNKPFSIILCDIDDFKQFNDQYGHDCGDFVLVTIAKIMSLNVRKQDLVARWGGEEFLLLLPETELEGGKIVAESLRTIISNNVYEYGGNKFNIYMTFGVSEFSKFLTVDECIKIADNALYKGKSEGKNCVCG
ncbi:two-component system, cell cycle response regulator [Candidatus Magnetomoraceae bacterium gMMP-15]